MVLEPLVCTVNAYSAISEYEWTLYLTSKDDDLFDNPGSLVPEELLNDVDTDGTGPNDGEFCVSRHGSRLFVVCVISETIGAPPLSIYPLSEP